MRVLGYDETELAGQRIAYLVLDYIDGESLKARLEELTPQLLPPGEFESIALSVLDALAFAHRKNGKFTAM